MMRLVTRGNWFAGLLIFFMPVLLIFFLGSQMAYGQVKGKFEAYQAIPEITRLSDLEALTPEQVIMLRGKMAADGCVRAGAAGCENDSGLIVFQERPAGGREVRYQEEFRQVFPKFELELAGGKVAIRPSPTRDRIIQHEAHIVSAGDREYTGFRSGDIVTVQGQWQPGRPAALVEVTGITSAGKDQLMREWQDAFQKVRWARNGLGGLTLLGLIMLIVQLRRTRNNDQVENHKATEEEEWQPQETTSAPITSL